MGLDFERFGNWVGKITSPSSLPANDDPAPAFREYNEAVRLRPKDAEPYYKRALAYAKADKNANHDVSRSHSLVDNL